MRKMFGLLVGVIAALAMVTAAAEPTCPEVDEEVILYPNPANCTTFYQCYNGSLVNMTCPDGLHYNAVLQVCDWPWAANCTETPQLYDFNTDGGPVEVISIPPPTCPPPGSEINATYFSNVYNCSAYYTCESGELTPRACPPTLHFNPLIGVCDFPNAANCKQLTAAMPADLLLPVTLLKKGGSPRIDPACQPDGPPNCPPPGTNGSLITCPNPYNCSEYYYCDNGKYNVSSCPHGLEYNVEIGNCDYDWAANCVELPPPFVLTLKNKLSAPKVATLIGRALNPACNPDGPPNCPPPGGNTSVITCPNPYNCSQYYSCDNGANRTNDCPPDLEYNAELGVCDFEWAVDCVAIPPPLTISLLKHLSVPKLTISGRALNPACNPDGPPNCPPPGGNTSVITCPNPYNCSQYYSCDNGANRTNDCPPDLEYNAELGVCDYEWAVDCVAIPPPLTITLLKHLSVPKLTISGRALDPACNPDGPPTCPPPGTNTSVITCPNPYDCSQYYSCDNGANRTNDCPPDLEYNAELGVCDYEWAVDCVAIPPPQLTFKKHLSAPKLTASGRAVDPACNANGPPSCPLPGPNATLINCPNPYNCSNYYYCDNGESHLRDCPPSLVYNAELGVCDYDWNAHCVALPPPLQLTFKKHLSAPKLTASGRALDPACNPDGYPSCPPPGGNSTVITCPNPYNCSTYYTCDNGMAFLRYCPVFLVYNPELGVCDYDYNVHCVAVPPPSEKISSVLSLRAQLKNNQHARSSNSHRRHVKSHRASKK